MLAAAAAAVKAREESEVCDCSRVPPIRDSRRGHSRGSQGTGAVENDIKRLRLARRRYILFVYIYIYIYEPTNLMGALQTCLNRK